MARPAEVVVDENGNVWVVPDPGTDTLSGSDAWIPIPRGRFRIMSQESGPPSGEEYYREGDIHIDDDGSLWTCATAGNPGSWRRVGPIGHGISHAAVIPIQCATTGNIDVTTVPAVTPEEVDGVPFFGGALLVRAQTVPMENGILVVRENSEGELQWLPARLGLPTTSWFDTDYTGYSETFIAGSLFYVQLGTVNGGKYFKLEEPNGNSVLQYGNTEFVFTELDL